MKRISTDNGATYITPEEALNEMDLRTMGMIMDKETMETVHAELAPCTDEEFLTKYLEIATYDLIIG